MKKIKFTRAILLTAALMSLLMYTTGAAEVTAPGSATDPVVTKSYVDEKIAEALSGIQVSDATVQSGAEISTDDLMLKIDFAVKKQLESLNISQTSEGTTDASYKVIQVLKGQKLIAPSDGTEIILRAGNCIVISPTDSLADVTDGTALKDGDNVSLNHLIIIPRSDRGVEVTKDAWFMIRGDYNII